jgi:DNA-binding HxlR family transcriptional regulator
MGAAEIFERRWVMQIIKVLAEYDELYFTDFLQIIPSMSDRLLSVRLRELAALDLVVKVDHEGHRPTYQLANTRKAQQAINVVRELDNLAGIPDIPVL